MSSIEGLSDAIVQALAEYTNEVEKGLEVEKKTVAEKAVQALKTTSPKRTGKYGKGWALKKDGTKYVVYNKTAPQLTHLLEFGHAKANGGRVAAKPHIRPVEENAVNDFVAGVKKVIKG